MRSPSSEQEAPQVVIVDPERAKHSRLPSDLLRLIVAVVVALVVALLGAGLEDVNVGATTDLIRIAGGLATPIIVSLALAIRLTALLLPLLVVTSMLRQQRYRRLLLVLFAAAFAASLAWFFESQLTSALQPALDFAPPEWVCPPQGADGPVGGCVTASGFPSTVYLAGFAAGFGVLAPWVSRRWRIAGWITIGVFLVARSIDGTRAPLDGLLVIALGYAIGAGTLLLFAAPDRRPNGRAIVDALTASGIRLSRLEWADVESKASTPYFGSTEDGRRLFVKVMSAEERAADAMYRFYRTARLRGDEGGVFGSVRRAAEHEAVVSLKAQSDGVRTPRLRGIAGVGPNAFLLAYEAVDGRTLDAVPDAELTDALLAGIWTEVRAMHERRTAHRNLAPGNIIVDGDGAVWIIDFGFAELAASDAQLNADVAELLLSLSARVGSERAVAGAVDVLGADAVRSAAPRLQPMAVSTSVRHLLAATKGLDEDVQDEVKAVTGLEEIEFASLERIRPRTLLTVVALGAAFYFLIPQLAQLDWADVAGADWAWFPLIVLFSAITYVGASWALQGSVPDRLPFGPTFFAQIASSFLNRITPAKVGGLALNVRYLQKRGVDTAVAATGVGISTVAGVIVHIGLLVIFLFATRTNAQLPFEPPSGEAVLVGLVVVVTVAGLVMVTPWGRRVFLTGVWPIIKTAAGGLAQIGTDPMKLLLVFGGSFVTTTGYMFALWYSIEAFGGGIGFITVAMVYLAGEIVAQAAPTPGGIGATEAVLIAGLTAFGLPSAVAVPAVFLYRIATFWVPILPGWAAFGRLQRDGAL
jgi:glycosyltransferase 2 family protein